MSKLLSIVQETPAHCHAITALHDSVFGPGRFARTAFRVRETAWTDPEFCFVALDPQDTVIGSVRLTSIAIGKAAAYLLGPLCVADQEQGYGVGRALVIKARKAVQHNRGLPILLVGDASYYGPLGFSHSPKVIRMPGPIDYTRLLIAWPKEISDKNAYHGVVRGVKSH